MADFSRYRKKLNLDIKKRSAYIVFKTKILYNIYVRKAGIGLSLKRVVIVEDERLILKGIERLFKWEQYGFSVVFSTVSPNEAFDFIHTHGTDVLLTDVRMREMTGFELITKLKNAGIEPLSIVISGYDNFEYMRSAIRLKVFDYCLKPLSEEDADEILRNLNIYFSGSDKEIDDNSVNRFDEVVDYINQNFDKKITLKDVSERFYFNMNYLSHALKKEFGMTLTDYLRKIRMEEARRLIRDGKTTTETAFLVGVADYAHFHKMYKKYWGVTPKEDRKEMEPDEDI